MSFKITPLHKLALEYSNQAIDENKIMNDDITELFYKSLYMMVRDRYIIKINMNGDVRKGKSTCAIEIARRIHEIMESMNKASDKFSGKNIVRTENEFSKIVRNKTLNNTIIVIDEINRMDHTGENSSTEDSFLMSYYEIMASYYVHRITCSPKSESDPNCEIYIETVAIDKQKAETMCFCFYNLFKGGETTKILLGYIRIDVIPKIKQLIKI